MCWSQVRPEGPWTPHGARLWHCWYLIDVQEKMPQTKHNYIDNDYVFFTPLLEDGTWLQNRKSFTFKHISVTFITFGKHKPWQENQVRSLSWARNHESRTWVERYEVSHSAASPIVHLTHSWACSWISWSALSSLMYWSVFVIRIWINVTPLETLSAGRSWQYNEHDDAVIGIIELMYVLLAQKTHGRMD